MYWGTGIDNLIDIRLSNVYGYWQPKEKTNNNQTALPIPPFLASKSGERARELSGAYYFADGKQFFSTSFSFSCQLVHLRFSRAATSVGD